jgi:uncharacterized protein YkwD
MARTGKYGHAADGRRPPQRAAAAGYDYCLVAENIAYQYRSSGYESGAKLAAELVEGRYFAVQMLGRPKSAAIRFSVQNRSRESVHCAGHHAPD